MSKPILAPKPTPAKPSLTLADICVVREVKQSDGTLYRNEVTGPEVLRLIELIQGVCPGWQSVLRDEEGIFLEMRSFGKLCLHLSFGEEDGPSNEVWGLTAELLNWWAARLYAAGRSDDEAARIAQGYQIRAAPLATRVGKGGTR